VEKIIWVAGMPRSGSMWTYNVLRNALDVSGYNVLPKIIPKSNEEQNYIAKYEALPDVNPKNIYVIKTHMYLNPNIPKSFVITTIRDVRDALISWMNFMNSDFETALTAAEGMTRNSDHYLEFPDKNYFRIRYENIKSHPEATIKEICQKLTLDISDDVINDIVRNFDKNNVAKLIKNREKYFNKVNKKGKVPDGVESVAGLNNSVRVYDKGTGFQSGHVSNYQDGEWRTILSPDQIEAMHDRLSPWLKANGYLKD
jgi:hypothetical protein